MAEKRLFIGNLPTNASESEVNKLFQKYDLTKIELKRKKVLDEETVFAFVNLPSKNAEKCVAELNGKKWKNNSIKVEIAKESFMDRLRKEHAEKNTPKTDTTNGTVPKSIKFTNSFGSVSKNKKIIFDDNDEVNDNKLLSNTTNDYQQSNDIPRRRNLPMFCGTASVPEFIPSLNEKPQLISKPETDTKSKLLTSTNQTNISMRKFEEFSDVWKDQPDDNDFVYGHRFENETHRKPVKRNSYEISSTTVKKRKYEDNVQNIQTKSNAESKRITALEEKWNSIKDKKNTISKALKNLDGNYSSKKIKFEEDNEEPVSESHKSVEEKKIKLFDQDSDEDDFQPNFNVKPYLEGKKGEKMLQWKMKFSNDERFQLNEKFIEDDDINEDHGKSNKPDSDSQKSVLLQRQLTRYDPTRPDHKILEKKSEFSIQKEKKKKVKKKPLRSEEQPVVETPAESKVVSVSKEKHYSVADSIKNVFKKDENSTFSLSALFDEKVKEASNSHVPNEAPEAIPLKNCRLESPFQNASESEAEDEEIETNEELVPKSSTVPTEKFLGQCGVWGETFFFRPDDSRLKEAVNFYKPTDKKKIADFDKQRSKLRGIVRKKLQNCKRDNKLFKQKLGSRINKTKFKMRLKRARL